MTSHKDVRDGSGRGFRDIYVIDGDDPVTSSPAYFALLDAQYPAVEPDPAVWTNIEAAISDDPRTSDRVAHHRRRGRRPMVMLLSVAAALVLLAGTAFIASSITTGSETSLASRELVDPSTGAVMMTVQVTPDGTGSVTSVSLPTLDEDSTYQLWSVVGDEVVSVGLLGHDPTESPLRIEGDPAVLALTIEQAGGVAVSTQDPVAVWTAVG